MKIEETRELFLKDDNFILSESDKLSRLYKLKRVIRAGQKRESVLDTESVAEHVFGMHILANYFLPLEDANNKLGKSKILETITWHDIEEAETGDIMSHVKTDEDRLVADEALHKVIASLPDAILNDVQKLMEEYEGKLTPEARFVRAIDKIEPLLEVYSGTEGYKTIMHDIDFTLEKFWETKRPHISDFPYVLRFATVMSEHLDKRGFFPK